jgi:hypothetical protein
MTPPDAIQQELRGPAIGLIVIGSLNAVAGLVALLSGLVRIFIGDSSAPITDDAERLGYVVGTVACYGASALSLFLSPLIIAGGVEMLRGRSLKLVRSAAILAMIPITSCCCLGGLPIGIWALQSLRKSEIENYFQRQRMS